MAMVLQVVQAPVSGLRVNPRNPRRISARRFEQLQRTMTAERDLLQARPLIALPDGTVIAGNQRLEAARALGWETVPTVFAELDEVQANLWTLLDNRPFGEDEEDLTAELLAELRDRGTDLDLTGFERAEIDRLLRRLTLGAATPDELPELPDREPDSKPGTVYELGPHRLLCGDATDPDQVASLLDDVEPLLITSDPPFGVSLDNGWRDRAGLNTGRGEAMDGGRRRRGGEHRTTSIASDEIADWSAAYELVPSAPVAYVWHASRYACVVQAGLERVGFEVRQQLIWNKSLFALSRAHYHWQHEPCFYATRVGATVPWRGPRNLSTVWEAASPKMVTATAGGVEDRKLDHPTQKPVLLFSRPIENHLALGEIVYDPFAGSGTALVAAELTGRVCYAVELDPRCCDLIRARYRELTCEL